MIDPSAWNLIAENRIGAAEQDGFFDRIEGFGKPLNSLDDTDPNRWIKRKLRAEAISVLPPALAVRLAKERFFETIGQVRSAHMLFAEVARLNAEIESANGSPRPDSLADIAPIDPRSAFDIWRRERSNAPD